MNLTFARLMLNVFLLCLIGILVDELWFVLSLGMAVYLAWTLWNLHRLLYWLHHRKTDLPESFGIWEIIFHKLYQLQAEQRKNKRQLAKMLKRFRKSTQALPEATVVLNKTYEIQWFNTAAKQYLQLSQPQDIGQKIDNLIRHPRFIQSLKNQKNETSLELTHNEYVLLIRLVPFDQKYILLSAQDITQKYRLELMLRDFIADASHELRTPLTVISGYVEQLNERLHKIDPSLHSPIQKMVTQTQRMQRLINDLLLLSRIEKLDKKISPVKLCPLLEEIHKEAQILSQNRHKIKFSCEEITLKGDEKELRIAFSNLIFNAVHYTKKGGEIEIQIYGDAKGYHVSIKDTGIGIAADHIPRLTERFYRVEKGRSRRGTGLGLAIVQRILDKHQGKLSIKSELGQGSLFQCYFLKR